MEQNQNNNNLNNINNIADLINHINELNITTDGEKTMLALVIIYQNPNAIKDLKDLKDSEKLSNFIVNQLNIKIDICKAELALGIINKNSNEIEDLKDSEKLLDFIDNQLNIKDGIAKNYLAIEIIEKKPEVISDLTSSKELLDFIIGQLKITNDYKKKDLAIKIMEKNTAILKEINTPQDLANFINQLNIKNNSYKKDLAIEIIKKKPEVISDLTSSEKLSNFIKAFGDDFHYRVDLICNLLKELPESIKISFKKLNNNLYNNDYLKEQLILEAIDSNLINNSNFLDCGFDDIKTEDIYLDILKIAKAKNIITDLDLLNHSKGRLSSKFTSMKESFDIDLEEDKLNNIFFNKGEALRTITSWFASSNNSFDIKKYKLLDIIEYCRASGKLTELNSLFKESFKEEIKNKYIPSSKKVITDVDIKEIAELTGFSIAEVKKRHISIGEMVYHLQPLFKDIKEATLDDVNAIKNDKIKEILTKTINNSVIDDQDVKSFYNEITGNEIKGEDIYKLKNFISSNKNILTYILKKEDGLARLAGVMHSIGDGCVANIANNLNNMAISFLLEDKNKNSEIGEKNKNIALELIYASLIQGILQQAVKDGDHLGGQGDASLIKNYQKDSSTDILNKRFITPDLLIKIMAEITIFNNHKGIIPQEVKDLILQSENYDLPKLVEKIIALFAVNKLIKDDKGQDKITNSNSATCNEVNKAIKEEEAKQQEYVPNQTIVIIDKSQISYNKENIYKK